MNIVTRPHMRQAMRHVSDEKKRAVQYSMDERRERTGANVIHVHEKPPRPKCSMPTDTEMNAPILAFIETYGREPDRIYTPFEWPWPDHGFAVQGLPPCPDRDVTSPYLRHGRYIPVKVIHDPEATEIRLGSAAQDKA